MTSDAGCFRPLEEYEENFLAYVLQTENAPTELGAIKSLRDLQSAIPTIICDGTLTPECSEYISHAVKSLTLRQLVKAFNDVEFLEEKVLRLRSDWHLQCKEALNELLQIKLLLSFNHIYTVCLRTGLAVKRTDDVRRRCSRQASIFPDGSVDGSSNTGSTKGVRRFEENEAPMSAYTFSLTAGLENEPHRISIAHNEGQLRARVIEAVHQDHRDAFAAAIDGLVDRLTVVRTGLLYLLDSTAVPECSCVQRFASFALQEVLQTLQAFGLGVGVAEESGDSAGTFSRDDKLLSAEIDVHHQGGSHRVRFVGFADRVLVGDGTYYSEALLCTLEVKNFERLLRRSIKAVKSQQTICLLAHCQMFEDDGSILFAYTTRTFEPALIVLWIMFAVACGDAERVEYTSDNTISCPLDESEDEGSEDELGPGAAGNGPGAADGPAPSGNHGGGPASRTRALSNAAQGQCGPNTSGVTQRGNCCAPSSFKIEERIFADENCINMSLGLSEENLRACGLRTAMENF